MREPGDRAGIERKALHDQEKDVVAGGDNVAGPEHRLELKEAKGKQHYRSRMLR